MLGSSPREAGEAMGRGTLGAAALHVRVQRKGTRGISWDEGLHGKATTPQASDRSGERNMDSWKQSDGRKERLRFWVEGR